MKIKYVTISTDDNPLYKGFWQLNSLFLQRINLIPVIFLISDKETDFIKNDYGIIKYINKNNFNAPSWFQAQMARFWGCQFFKEDVCMTSDVDMFLLNENYFKNCVNDINEDQFTNLTCDAYTDLRLPICYNIGTGKIFKNVLNIDDSFNGFIEKTKYFKGIGWDTDEFYVAYCASKFKNFVPKIRKFIQTGNLRNANLRIDRSDWKIDHKLKDYYIDAHCIRPIETYKNEINTLCNMYDIKYE